MSHYLLFSLLVSSAFAQTGARDWHLTQELDPTLKTQVCRAWTATSNSAIPLELSASFPQANDKAPVVTIKFPANSGVTKVTLTGQDLGAERFFPLVQATSAADSDVLWYIPMRMEDLIQTLLVDSNLAVTVWTKEGASKVVTISLAGSTATLSQTAQCLKRDEVLPANFFNALVAKLNSSTTLGNDQSLAQLFEYVQLSFVEFNERGKSQNDLKQLTDQLSNLSRQESKAKDALASAQGDLDQATRAKATTQGKIDQANQRLAQIPSELNDLSARKKTADAALTKAQTDFDPVRKKAQPLQDSVESAQADVQQLLNSISRVNQSLSDANDQIASLQAQLQQLNQDISDRNRQIQNLRNLEITQQSQLNNFNVESERRRLLEQDFRYAQLRDQFRRQQDESRSAKRDADTARGALLAAQAVLQACRAKDAQAPCAIEQTAVNVATNAANSADQKARSADSAAENSRREMQQIESTADQRANDTKTKYASDLTDTQTKLVNLTSQQADDQSKANSIANFEIPNQQRTVNDARNTQLPSLQRELRNARNDLNNASSALDSFRQASNYEALESAFNQAQSVVAELAASIDQTQSEQKKWTQNIPIWQKTLDQQSKLVGQRTAARDLAQTSLTAIQTQLQPGRDRQAELTKIIADLNTQFEEARALFQLLAAKWLAL